MKTNPKLTDMASHKNVKHTEDSLLVLQPANGKIGLIFFVVSLVFHGSFFAVLIYFQDFRLPKSMPPVIQIDLVSFAPEPYLEEEPSAPVEEKTEDEGVSTTVKPVEKKPPKIQHKKPDISLKTKPKNLKKLVEQKKKEKKNPVKKKEKVKPEKPKVEEKKQEPQKSAEPEKSQEDEDQARIAEILKKLQQQVKEQGPSRKTAGKGASPGSRRSGLKPIDVYHSVMGFTFEQNWVFNDVLAKMDKNLEVKILIKILKSGEIRDIIFDTKSGNRYLDESAKKAILKSNPLPPLPAGMSSYDVVVIFGPDGIK